MSEAGGQEILDHDAAGRLGADIAQNQVDVHGLPHVGTLIADHLGQREVHGRDREIDAGAVVGSDGIRRSPVDGDGEVFEARACGARRDCRPEIHDGRIPDGHRPDVPDAHAAGVAALARRGVDIVESGNQDIREPHRDRVVRSEILQDDVELQGVADIHVGIRDALADREVRALNQDLGGVRIVAGIRIVLIHDLDRRPVHEERTAGARIGRGVQRETKAVAGGQVAQIPEPRAEVVAALFGRIADVAEARGQRVAHHDTRGVVGTQVLDDDREGNQAQLGRVGIIDALADAQVRARNRDERAIGVVGR